MLDYDAVTNIQPYIAPNKSTSIMDLNQPNFVNADAVYPRVLYQNSGINRQISIPNIQMDPNGVATDHKIYPQPDYTLLYIIIMVLIILSIPFFITMMKKID